MLKLVYAALNVRPEEQQRALLLLGFGFFMGIFLATFQLTSETQLITQAGAGEDSAGRVAVGIAIAIQVAISECGDSGTPAGGVDIVAGLVIAR